MIKDRQIGGLSMSIRTERLDIKPYAEEDGDRMAVLLTNEEIKKTFMIPDLSVDEAKTLFYKMMNRSQMSEQYVRGIYLHDMLIGFVNDVGIDNRIIEMGYVIDPHCQKQGFATEAFQAIIQDLFRMGFIEVIAGAFAENIASLKVMEKCGMKRLDKTDELTYRGRTHHCIYYSIKKEETIHV